MTLWNKSLSNWLPAQTWEWSAIIHSFVSLLPICSLFHHRMLTSLPASGHRLEGSSCFQIQRSDSQVYIRKKQFDLNLFSPQDTHTYINTVSKVTWDIGTVSLPTANLTCQENISTAVMQLDLRERDFYSCWVEEVIMCTPWNQTERKWAKQKLWPVT